MDSAELTRSTEFWFEDGTVVLQVEKTLYRVYRGLLSSRSTVFRDTFSIPQPTEEGTQIEGCPVVQLHDKARDFSCFLKALHHYAGAYNTCPVAGIKELCSVLRLSDKYDAHLLRQSMISILSDIYPSTLNKWTHRKDKIPPGYRDTQDDPIHVLNIARDLDIRRIIPGAMYQVCRRYDIENILYGVRGKPHLKIIDEDDRKRCAFAIPALMLAKHQVLVHYLMHGEDEFPECDDQAVCDAERLRWLAIDFPGSDATDPLCLDVPWEAFGVCDSCLEATKKIFADDQQAMWDELPSNFNLGSWKELLA
ncbi:hypothetical protein B0H11DRAFT_2207755 [Mycena galericulata]|nr:hypothetical protein B0H11DRAFT_2207755 [Mycena galericulata]